MYYLSFPNGTHAVFYPSRRSQGAFDVHKLMPGRRYGGLDGGPGNETYVGTTDSDLAARAWADREGAS